MPLANHTSTLTEHDPHMLAAHPRFRRIATHSFGANGTGNFLIHGENLAVMRDLADMYRDRIKCIYLDPPYNNGESYLHYFDSMGHDEWLSAVSQRLQVARELLHPEGSLWISIDDSEVHYLKVAADQVFGRNNFVATVVWERRKTRENRKAFSRNHEYLLVYAKNAQLWRKRRNGIVSEALASRFKNPDSDPRGPWQSVSANVQGGHGTAAQWYTIASPSGKVHSPPKGRCWVYNKPRMDREIAAGNIYFGRDGSGVPRIKKFADSSSTLVAPNSLWRADEVGTTSTAKKELLEIFQEEPLFDTPKPEALIRRLLEISTHAGDLVLDPYLGSGTTAAVAHKLQRRYIGIEQGEHIKSHCARRLIRVIQSDPTGVSGAVGWMGGGGFDFVRHQRKRA